jgi:ornithine cyclodeaminase
LRVRTNLPGPGTAAVLLPGLIDGVPAYTVKVNAKFPGGNPALRGVVCLHSLVDGELLALLDSATVTAWRTGLAAALATHVLARPEADTVAVIGAGAQADLMTRALAVLRPLSGLSVYDVDPTRARSFATRHATAGLTVQVTGSAQEAVTQAGIVLMATWTRTPLLRLPDLPAGVHVTSLGADEPGKVELGADILMAGRLVVDDVRLALQMGAPANAGLGADAVAATLGSVLAGRDPGREHSGQLTLYTPVGLPWQDLALAWPVFQAALAQPRTELDFLA